MNRIYKFTSFLHVMMSNDRIGEEFVITAFDSTVSTKGSESAMSLITFMLKPYTESQ